jgi:drug/metabolite transporter (DMT)-like permease
LKESYKAHASLLVTALIYGANYTIAKGVMPAYIEPFGFILLRISGAVLLFWLTGLFYPEKIEKKDLSLFAVCALF